MLNAVDYTFFQCERRFQVKPLLLRNVYHSIVQQFFHRLLEILATLRTDVFGGVFSILKAKRCKILIIELNTLIIIIEHCK